MPESNWHATSDISGIGPKLAAELMAMGYPVAESLLKLAPLNVARDLEPVDGITLNGVLIDFVPQAELLRIDGISPEAVNAFHKRRIDYSRLAFGETERLQKILTEAGVQSSVEQVLRWQLNASLRLGKSRIYLVVEDEDGAPVEGADVYVADPPASGDGIAWHWRTRAGGIALIEFLAPGVHEVVVVGEERCKRLPISLGWQETVCLMAKLDVPAPGGVVYDERKDGIDPRWRPWIRRNFENRDSIPEGEILEVTDVSDNALPRLSTVLRKQVGASWVIESISIERESLPKAAMLGMLFVWNGSAFELLEGTADGVRRELMLAAAANAPEKFRGGPHANRGNRM